MIFRKYFLLLILGFIIMGCSDKDNPKVLKVEKIDLSSTNLVLVEGTSYQLSAKVIPYIYDINLVWTSSDETVISVMNNGIITALSVGDADVSVSIGDAISSCSVSVVKKHIPVKSVSIENSITLKVDEEYDLNVKVFPDNASNKNYILLLSEKDVISTDGGASIVAVKPGKCIITVSSYDGNKTAKCQVTVVDKNIKNSCIDKDGREYSTIQIGNQVWMAENLAYLDSENFNNGAFVYNFVGSNLEEAKNNDFYKMFGVLYTYQSIGRCIPDGWHLPSDKEWQELELYIGMLEKEISSFGSRGSKSYTLMCEDGWSNLSFKPTNETKFSAKPAGYRSSLGSFKQVNFRTVFWGSISDDGSIIGRALFNSSTKINRSKANSKSAYSVRLIKDL